jgi:DNA polymerase-3 subunit beta
MKFQIKVGDLLNAVNDVSFTIDKKSTEGSGGILVRAFKTETEAAVLLYTTLHKAETVIKHKAEVEVPGQALLDPSQLRAGLLHRNPDDLADVSRIEKKDHPVKIEVKIGKSVFHLSDNPTGMDEMAKRMQEIPFRQPEAYTMKGQALSEFVRRVSFCIPNENEGTQQFELGGMRLLCGDEGFEAQATDGHACARIIIKGEKGPQKMESILLPRLALPALAKLVKKEDGVKVIEGPKNGRNDVVKLFFKIGDNTFFGTRLLLGTFPAIVSVLRTHAPDFWFKIDREQLKQVLERAPAFDELLLVKLQVVGDVIRVITKGKNADITDELPIEREEGMPADLNISITTNLPYVKNVASGSNLEKLRFGVSDYNVKAKAAKALIVDDANDGIDATYAIMPVRP